MPKVLGQLPSNMLLNYIGRPAYYLGFFTIAWGLVSALTALTQSFAGIVACRLVLGLVGKPAPGPESFGFDSGPNANIHSQKRHSSQVFV